MQNGRWKVINGQIVVYILQKFASYVVEFGAMPDNVGDVVGLLATVRADLVVVVAIFARVALVPGCSLLDHPEEALLVLWDVLSRRVCGSSVDVVQPSIYFSFVCTSTSARGRGNLHHFGF